MPSLTFSISDCPHNYYPSYPDRKMKRVSMKDGSLVVGVTDYFIHDEWSHFLYFYVDPSHKTTENVLLFINNVYDLVTETNNTFWWRTPKVMETYLIEISEMRPDMTFVAGGEINKVFKAKD